MNTDKLCVFNCNGCKWLNINNLEYDNNMIKLVIVQRWENKILLRKKIINLISHIILICHHPPSLLISLKYAMDFLTKMRNGMWLHRELLFDSN